MRANAEVDTALQLLSQLCKHWFYASKGLDNSSIDMANVRAIRDILDDK